MGDGVKWLLPSRYRTDGRGWSEATELSFAKYYRPVKMLPNIDGLL